MGFLTNGRSHDSDKAAAAEAGGAEPVANGSNMIDLVKAEGGGAGEDELGRIRELLFGVEMSRLREDLGRVDEQVAQHSGELRELVSRRLDTFERNVESRLDKMEQRLDTESHQRLEAYGQLEGRIEAERKGLEESVEQLAERMDEGQAQQTAQLQGQGKLFSESIRRHCQQLSDHFEREAEALAQVRADRSAVAKTLLELAKQLDHADDNDDNE